MNVAERVRGEDTGALMMGRCLGAFRLQDVSGNEMQFRTRKARAMLALLALNGRPMSRAAVAGLLWSDRAETQARASLRQTIHELQHLDWGGSPLLIVGRDDVAIARDTLVTDLELIRAASLKGDWPRLLTLLESSDVGLLADLDGLDPELDQWLRVQRAHEPDKTMAAAIEAAQRCASEAGPRAGLDVVGEILRLDPANEEATRLAMRFANELGDRVALHRHFAALRERLRADYDAEPSAETLELFARLGNARTARAPTSDAPLPARAPDAQRSSRLRLAVAAVAAAFVLVALVALAWTWRGGRPTTAAPPGVVVAVLPFEQQPPDSSYLAAGMWEQTRAALTRNPSIRVLGPATTNAMAAQKLAPDQYLRRFGVTHVLEGTVHRSGSDLLVSVSLTRTSDGVAVWQDSFRGRMGEPFALQQAVATGIEGKLRAQLAPGGGRRAEQIATLPEVYAAYSEARQLIALREFTSTERARVLLEKAVATDPNYAPAWALLAEAIYFDGPAAVQDSKRRKQAAQTVQHALSLAPNFAPALAISALIDGEASKEAEAPLRRAVALDPSYSEAWNWLGNSLVSQERSSEAISAYEHAVAADPFFYPAVSNLAAAAIGAGDQATIDRLLARLTTARADPDMIANVKAQQAYARGDVSESLRLVEQRGLDGGHPNPLLWDGWFSGLTALGYYDLLHKVTGCPDWYAPLLAGKTLPPMRLNGAPVNPEDFWSSVYFSAPAARAMVRFGRSNDLVKVYRAGFRSVDDFVVTTDRRGILPEVAPDLALALEESGSPDEASYVLTATSLRLEQSLKRLPQGSPTAQLAIIRAAQGDRVRALALLDLALRRGWFPDGRAVAIDLAEEPALRALRGDRRFEAMRRRILDHVARERAELGPLKV